MQQRSSHVSNRETQADFVMWSKQITLSYSIQNYFPITVWSQFIDPYLAIYIPFAVIRQKEPNENMKLI